jgi:hypothetical protein
MPISRLSKNERELYANDAVFHSVVHTLMDLVVRDPVYAANKCRRLFEAVNTARAFFEEREERRAFKMEEAERLCPQCGTRIVDGACLGCRMTALALFNECVHCDDAPPSDLCAWCGRKGTGGAP